MSSSSVAVVIPTHNRAERVGAVLDSICSQTYSPAEVIVVDDGSRDHTQEVLRRCVRKDPRVSVYTHDASRGAAAARNTGWRRATAEYVAFNDDDALWRPEKLARQMALANDPQPPDILYCKTRIRRTGGPDRVFGAPVDSAQGPLPTLLRRNVMSTPSVVVRREALAAVGGFDEALTRLEDWDLYLRLAETGKRFRYLPEVLVEAEMVAGGLSDGPDHLADSVNHVLGKLRECPRVDRAGYADALFHTGYLLCYHGCEAEGLRRLRQAWRRRPAHPRLMAGAVLSALHPRLFLAATHAAARWLPGTAWQT